MSSPVVPGASPRPCVLLLGIDGFRPDCVTADLAPNLWALMHSPRAGTQTAYSLQSQVGDICWSGPGWTSCCTGVWRDKHGVSGNTFGTRQFEAYPPLFARVKSARPEAVTACAINWKPLSEFILLPADHACTHEDDDTLVTESACRLLKELPRVDCMMVHLDDVDLQGHTWDYGPHIPEYAAAVKAADARVGQILATLHNERAFVADEDWLVIVTTDHGGIEYTHEDGRPENRTNFVIVSGRDATSGEIFPSPVVVDVAPTVWAHLGVKLRSSWHLDGRPVGLRLTGKGSFMCLESSQDPHNKYPIPPEELEEGPAPDAEKTDAIVEQAAAAVGEREPEKSFC